LNNIKQEMKKIEIPKDLHKRARLGVKKAKLEQPTRRKKKSFAATAAIALISCGILFSPTGQAMFKGLFEVTKFEKSANNEEISFGYSLNNLEIYDERVYGSLTEIEDVFNVNIPFPHQLLIKEENKESVEHRVLTDEDGQLSSYHYQLATSERSYKIVATNKVEAEVNFSAATSDGTGIEKDIVVNGVSAKLLSVNEMDGYTIYIENENWKMIISCFDRASNLEGTSDVKEEEIIEIAESIK
jgi:hypothetical protein